MNKGLMNLHSLVYEDRNNIANLSNTKLFANIVKGYADSNAFNYLLGMTNIGISDIRSLNFFNETGLADTINAHRSMEEVEDDSSMIALPKPKNVRGSLSQALKSRQSTRAFSSYRMNLNELSTLLAYSVGISNRYSKDAEGNRSFRRYHGSGGGIYPISVYCVVNAIEGLRNGIYLYRPYTHALKKITYTGNLEELYQNAPIDTQNANMSLLFSYELNRNYLKYGELGMLLAFVETGMMAQNIHLVANSVGYSSCDVAGFDKKYAEKSIGLDGVNSHIIYSIMVGKEQ